MPAQSAVLPDTPAAPQRILVIDDDSVMREYLQACLESGFPGVEVAKYDPLERGRPGADFRWGDHDVLLLDYDLGNGENGVQWLEAFGQRSGFPRTLLLTVEDSARVIGSAVRAGAGGCLNKARLKPRLLVESVRDLLEDTSVFPAMPGPGTSEEDSTPKYRGSSSLDTGPGGCSYRFIRLIGQGGMSRVYLAERSEDRMTAVLKILDRNVAQDPENVQRFAFEGELISMIDSPYVVKVFDHGFTNSYGYIAMEFFGRGDLAHRMENGLRPDDALLYLHNIACALNAIHQLGIVHRDLKPANVMFRGDDSMALVDFGLSKSLLVEQSLTKDGVIMGTPYCMSPEQTLGSAADHRSDLYGAGVIFYEMLCGKRPYRGPNLPGLMQAIQSQPVPRLPGELKRYQGVVDRLLAKDPADRYQSAGELIEALQRLR
jgi:CheY-like chemotaxis protein